ncbi:lantibiotic dehydratase C-terminal domain-containing protein, partial [Pseudomonas savastanoi]|uniref:lantibiotic dehydratase C-terminal domain-containing protein n=1 Tax=Pseudomonas savastanoi TaxID=29438 RepID=UPI00399D69EF
FANSTLDELILVRDAGITELLRWEKNSLTLLTAVRLQAYVHMSCNRFFSTDRRLREMLVCDLLRRSYEKNLIRFDNSKLSTTEK